MQSGSVMGTVSNANGDTVANATVALESTDGKSRRQTISNENGFFEFHDLKPGVPFYVIASTDGLAE